MVTALIGCGKVAQSLLSKFKIDFCLVRKLSKVHSLQSFSDTTFTDNYSDLKNVDYCIIAVSDSSIESVAQNLKKYLPKKSIVVHTSGSVGLDVLQKYFEHCGVMYPLYPFAQGVEVDFSKLTMMLESPNKEVINIEKQFLEGCGCNMCEVSSSARANIHISAVFVCNFTNHVMSLAQTLLQKDGLDINILKPLFEKIHQNIMSCDGDISSLQTGPAVREDKNVIEKHLKKLEQYDTIYNVYDIITKSIIQQKNDNKKL